MKHIVHLTTNIEYLLRNYTNEKLGLLFDVDGDLAKKELLEMLEKGQKLLPSENCKHFDPVHGCMCEYYDENGNLIEENI